MRLKTCVLLGVASLLAASQVSAVDCQPSPGPLAPEVDCDGNGIPDACDASRHVISLPPTRGLSLDYSPLGFTLFDFDGDGDQDLVTGARVGPSDGRFGFLELLDNGALEQRWQEIEGTLLPLAPVVELVDEDELPDVVVFTTKGLVILRNEGNGVFQSSEPVPDTRLARAAYVGDLDGDGRRDLLTDSRLGVPQFHRRSADGTYRLSGAFPDVESCVFTSADFDGDGLLDIAALCIEAREGIVLLYINKGNHDFFEPLRLSLGRTWGGDLYPGDLDGDGFTDLAVATQENEILVLLNSGPGFFLFQTIAAGRSGRLLLTDFTGDGQLDLSLQTGEELIGFVNKGAAFDVERSLFVGGAMAFPFDFNRDRAPEVVTVDETELRIFSADWRGVSFDGLLTSMDVDVDGRHDLISATPSLRVVLKGVDPTLVPRAGFGSGSSDVAAAESVDLNDDGLEDIVVVSDESDLSVHINRGGGLFADATRWPFPGGDLLDAATDFTGDGRKDLLVGGQGLALLRNQGDATFSGALWLVSRPFHIGDVVSGDFDRDGHPDVVALVGRPARVPHDLFYFRGGPQGTLGGAAVFGEVGFDTRLEVLRLGEKRGLVIASLDPEQAEVVMYHAEGDGLAPLRTVSGLREPREFATGDFDGDGVDDLLVVEATDPPRLSYYPSDGPGAFGTPLEFELLWLPESLVVADFDGDDDLDVAFQFEDGGVNIALNQAAGKSPDRNDDGQLDVCQRSDFVRGDCDGDGTVRGVSDALAIVGQNFLGAPASVCPAACDANGDGIVRGVVTDAIYLLGFNFLGGPAPPAPFPECGPLSAADEPLGCVSASCP